MKTRSQLKEIRIELVETIQELNKLKGVHRERLKEIVELKAEIVKLKDEIQQLKNKIAELEKEIQNLKDKIAEHEATIKKQQETIADREAEIKALKKRIEELIRGTTPVNLPVFLTRMTPGRKGTVVDVSEEWNYVVIEVSDQFLDELLGKERQDPFLPVEFIIRRPDEHGKVVTKAKLVSLKLDKKLAVADILLPWKQTSIKKGDAVLYEHQPQP